MKQDKLFSYLGFCQRAGALRKGYNTCLSLIKSGKVKLLICCEDCSDNTKDKLSQKCKSRGTDFRIYGRIEELSRVTGSSGNGIFAVTDGNFAKVIEEEIDRIQAEGVIA